MKPASQQVRPAWPAWAGIFGGQALLLAVAALHNGDQLNTDGIAYLRLAHYYAHGPLHLAVSGYWGPLLSWLLAPLLAAGLAPLTAARVVMAGTAVVYLGGCVAWLGALGLPRPWRLIGGALAAVGAVGWSVEYISPDLLVAGLMLLALATMLGIGSDRSWWRTAGSGALWGLAVLAKAVALPLAAGLGLLFTLVNWLRHPRQAGLVWRRFLLLNLVCVLILGPWVAALSQKYGRLTFSTSARAAHAVVGPPDRDRYHPFARRLYHPEPGRLTAWEDPTSLPYATWSPFDSGAAFRHQIRVSVRNLGTATALLAGFDLLHLGLLAAGVLAVLALLGRRAPASVSPESVPATARTWIPLVLVCLVGVYLPGYLERVDQRYFYAAWPCLFGGGVWVGTWLRERLAGRADLLSRLLLPLVAVSFAAPALINLGLSLPGRPAPVVRVARATAAAIRATGRSGPVAGSGLLAGSRSGLLVAWFLGEPWYGDRPDAGPDDFAAIAARWVIVGARRPVVEQLTADTRFADRTAEVLAAGMGPDTAPSQWPLRIFERTASATDRGATPP